MTALPLMYSLVQLYKFVGMFLEGIFVIRVPIKGLWNLYKDNHINANNNYTNIMKTKVIGFLRLYGQILEGYRIHYNQPVSYRLSNKMYSFILENYKVDVQGTPNKSNLVTISIYKAYFIDVQSIKNSMASQSPRATYCVSYLTHNFEDNFGIFTHIPSTEVNLGALFDMGHATQKSTEWGEKEKVGGKASK
ncbi:hypothetical protein ACJX0J_012263 [Zea mays]